MSVPRLFAAAVLIALALIAAAHAEPPTAAATNPRFDPALAQELGADEYGMRSYVLVLLRSSDHPVPQGPERAAMFKGHLANIRRLAKAGTLVMAGPLDGRNDLRGLFVFAVKDIEAARQLVKTDPVIAKGEMVAEYHDLYSSAAVMQLNDLHERLMKKSFAE